MANTKDLSTKDTWEPATVEASFKNYKSTCMKREKTERTNYKAQCQEWDFSVELLISEISTSPSNTTVYFQYSHSHIW